MLQNSVEPRKATHLAKTPTKRKRAVVKNVRLTVEETPVDAEDTGKIRADFFADKSCFYDTCSYMLHVCTTACVSASGRLVIT